MSDDVFTRAVQALDEERAKSARLKALNVELLEALKEALPVLNDAARLRDIDAEIFLGTHPHDVERRARAVIAKAEKE